MVPSQPCCPSEALTPILLDLWTGHFFLCTSGAKIQPGHGRLKSPMATHSQVSRVAFGPVLWVPYIFLLTANVNRFFPKKSICSKFICS